MTSRFFRKAGGFHEGDQSAIEIRTDDSAYRSIQADGSAATWGEPAEGEAPFFTIALAEQRVAAGVWEEVSRGWQKP